MPAGGVEAREGMVAVRVVVLVGWLLCWWHGADTL
jgi:hypothetical protein